ncbi:MAG: cation:proton antiporter [bacterium]
MGSIDLVLTLTLGLTIALILGYVMQRLRLPTVAGYLLAGIVVSPSTPGMTANPELADQLASVGIILLMFGVGLQFNFKKLMGVQRLVLPGAVIQSLTAAALGTLAAILLGYDWKAGLAFGLAICVASTVALTRVLSDNNKLHTPVGNIAVGWLVIEDLLTVLIMVLLPAIFGSGPAGITALSWSVGVSLFKISLLILIAFFLGGWLIPWLLRHVAATRSRELFTLTILVVALGIAVCSSLFFGVSMALGAFLGGMVVGRSDFNLRASTEALPLRDTFAVLFFVSVGMLFNPHHLLELPGLCLAALGLVLIGKPLIAASAILLLGYPTRIAFSMAVSLAQIGEFSFILASLGSQLGLLPPMAGNALVMTSILSLMVNPLLFRLVDPAEQWLARRPRLWRFLNRRANQRNDQVDTHSPTEADRTPPSHRAIIIGYGPVGQTLTQLLRKNNISTTIIEMNLETVDHLRAQNITVMYGDASHVETLKRAGAARTATLILSAPGIATAPDIIRHARELNPDIHILAHAGYLKELHMLHTAGANHVFSGEAEVAFAMTASILRQLGASPDQIDREGDQLRLDLLDQKNHTKKFFYDQNTG